MSNFIDRNEIKSRLEKQFSELKKSGLNADDIETIVFSENDITDTGLIEGNSSNWQFAREMQQSFIQELRFS